MITDNGALSSRARKPKYEMPTHLWADMIFRQPPELLGVGRAGRTANCCCTEHKSGEQGCCSLHGSLALKLGPISAWVLGRSALSRHLRWLQSVWVGRWELKMKRCADTQLAFVVEPSR